MSWVAVGVSTAGAVKGKMDADHAGRQQKEHNQYRKAAIQYSPWTGMTDPGAGNFGNPDAMSGMLGGGLQGFAMGSQINSLAGAQGAAKGAEQMAPPQGAQPLAMNYQTPQPNQMGGFNKWQGVQQTNPMVQRNPGFLPA